MRNPIVLALLVVAALAARAEPLAEKGFVFVTGTGPALRAEPKADAASTATLPVGGRLVYKKVVREGDAIAWFFVEMPGAGTGWLAAANAADKRPGVGPAAKPVKPAPVPSVTANATASTAGARAFEGFAQSSSAQTAGSRGFDEKLLAARGLSSVDEAGKLRTKALRDYLTLERAIGIQMSDPPHPDGRYADLTARGRKADSEKIAAETTSEGN